MYKFSDIVLSSRLAFQTGLIARPLGLLGFTVVIAHRWPMSEIARFESFSILQYILFFSWLPAWSIVMLRLGSNGKEEVQKSFLFSGQVGALFILSVFLLTAMTYKSYFLPWSDLNAFDLFNIVLFLFFYFLLQSFIYLFYLDGEVKKQWVLSCIQFLTFVFLAFLTPSIRNFFIGANVVLGCTLVFIHPAITFSKPSFDKIFWKEVLHYSVYFSFGAGTIILASYYVQAHFGLSDTLNWFRYGTRELPVLPTLLAGFGQSFLVHTEGNSPVSIQTMKEGIRRFINLLTIPLSILVLFSVPIINVLYGVRFAMAAPLMSAYLLIYIPRMIPSGALLQIHDDRKALLWIGFIEFLFVILMLSVFYFGLSLLQVVWILIAATVIEKILQIAVLKRKHHISILDYVPITAFTTMCAVLILAFIFQQWIKWN